MSKLPKLEPDESRFAQMSLDEPHPLHARISEMIRRIVAVFPREHRFAVFALLILGGVAYCARSDQVQLGVIVATTVIVVLLTQRHHAQTHQGGQDGPP